VIFEAILLTCGKQLNAERTVSNIFHLLNGKRSIQTVQDAHLYHTEKFYGIWRNLKPHILHHKISELIDGGLLEEASAEEAVIRITPKGEQWLIRNQWRIAYFRGLDYYMRTGIFYQRLLLLIQTMTNSKKQHFSFIPIVDKKQITNWVKQFYRKVKGSEGDCLMLLYQELESILNDLSEMEANFFVDRLTGFHKFGLSTDQLTKKYELSSYDVQLLLTAIIHRILNKIDKEPAKLPLLSSITKDLAAHALITNSASYTYQLLKNNYSPEAIAQIRNLKQNTIQDHIVEIAIYEPNFPISQYVSTEHQQEIAAVLSYTKSNKLKNIKQLVNENITYFEIRLMVTIKNSLEKQGD